MQYVAAAALASLSGNAPSRDSIIAILKATNKPVD
jgi:ribosomal protein L12E/L44/L45/RPP1/RPP2